MAHKDHPADTLSEEDQPSLVEKLFPSPDTVSEGEYITIFEFLLRACEFIVCPPSTAAGLALTHSGQGQRRWTDHPDGQRADASRMRSSR